MNNALNEGDGLWNFSGNVCFYRPKTLFICDDLTTNLSTRTIILALCRIFVVKSEKIGFPPVWRRYRVGYSEASIFELNLLNEYMLFTVVLLE